MPQGNNVTEPKGGPVKKHPYLVGEVGPERFVVPSDGFIYTRKDHEAWLKNQERKAMPQGNNLIWTIVGVLAIIALVLYIF